MLHTWQAKRQIEREIKHSGTKVEFFARVRNNYGEPESEINFIGSAICLYHEQNSSVAVTTNDVTQTRTKKIPMILMLFDAYKNLELKTDYIAKLNGKNYIVNGAVNIDELNITADVTLEVMDCGAKI